MDAPALSIELGGPGEPSPVGRDVIVGLEQVIAATGLDASLRDRYSVVFAFPGMGVGRVYPDLAGCTLEVCTFIDEASAFAKHGINVIGLSGERSETPEGCLAIPFPVGLIEQDSFAEPIAYVEQDGRRYAQRATFLVFPDGSGLRISAITDIAAHVRGCLGLVLEHRLERFRQETISADVGRLRSTAQWGELLPNGATSVAINRFDVTIPLVVKMAAPDIIREEAGYIRRVNSLLEDAGRPRLFPGVVAVNDQEDPAWYVMEAADPVPLDHVLFADEARTVLDPDRAWLLDSGIDRLSNLYELTYRREVAPVAPYHYRDRFSAIPRRPDMQLTHQLLVGGELGDVLDRPVIVDGIRCRTYSEQVAFLDRHVDDLAQPVGAYLHGDVHLPNMLIAGGESVVFIDPRTVWDGIDVGDPGFGDPLYDFATLLHSLHVMSAILHAIDTQQTVALLSFGDGGDAGHGPIEARSERLLIHRNPIVDSFRASLADRLTPDFIGRNWQARLHVGTANALLGWLKYARSVQTRDAWLAIFISVLYHLEIGRRLLTGEEES